MEAQVDAGRTKFIGVSDFNIRQMDRLMQIARIPPSTNQVECHLYFQQKELREWGEKHGVPVTAFACLGSPAAVSVFNGPKNMKEGPKDPTETSGVVGFRLHGRPPLSSGRLATPGLPEPSCETLLTVLLELRSFFSLSDLSSTSFIFSGQISPTSSFLQPHVGVTSSFFPTGAYRRTRGVSLNCRRD
ncbi:hypothetical protein J6590_087447 [Homalodisca vitripennis]|nr:hypothetical protein J6590_087447 [Homalodisca vitripennis]